MVQIWKQKTRLTVVLILMICYTFPDRAAKNGLICLIDMQRLAHEDNLEVW